MHRLFVAIRPPAALSVTLRSIMSGVEGARWQEDAQLHLTLRFIGEVDRHAANDIAAALASIAFTPFPVTIAGLGHFEHRGRIDTLWAGATPREPLERLHRKIDRACVQAGQPPEGRAYIPHITLARFGRSAGAIAPFMATHAGLATTPFLVDSFYLYESRLGHGGSSYHAVQRYGATPDIFIPNGRDPQDDGAEI
jgi:2'-5' RNA ligase